MLPCGISRMKLHEAQKPVLLTVDDKTMRFVKST